MRLELNARRYQERPHPGLAVLQTRELAGACAFPDAWGCSAGSRAHSAMS